jgi:hypothetical protein
MELKPYYSPTDVERLVEVSKTNVKKFALKRLALKAEIEKKYPQVTVRFEGDAIRILEGVESSEYNHRRFFQMLGAMKHKTKRMLNVDISNMKESEKQDHDRRIEIQSKVNTVVERELSRQRTVIVGPSKSPY